MATKIYHISYFPPFAFARLNALLASTFGLLTVIIQIIRDSFLHFTAEKPEVTYLNIIISDILAGIIFIITSLIVGGIIGLVVSVVYNWWAKKVGGVKIELDELN